MSQATHPKRLGCSVEAAVIDADDDLEYVPDREAEWFDARTTAPITPEPTRPLGSVCVVPAETPVEIKGCIPEQSNGSRTTPGRWYIKRGSHEQLLQMRGHYYLVVYAPTPDTPILSETIVPAAAVGDLLNGSWYDNGREGQVAKLTWKKVIDTEAVPPHPRAGGGAR